MKRTKKVFRDDGGLSSAFCERLRHQIDIYHAVGDGLSIAHLYGAFEDAEYVYSVQELCTGEHITFSTTRSISWMTSTVYSKA